MAKTREYHLIDLACGVSHGGFVSLAGARQFAREEALAAWEVWLGNERIERHDPIAERAIADSAISSAAPTIA